MIPSWCKRRGPLCELHLTWQASLCLGEGERNESTEQAAHQPEEVQASSWGPLLSPRVLSDLLQVGVSPTIKDSNWKPLMEPLVSPGEFSWADRIQSE